MTRARLTPAPPTMPTDHRDRLVALRDRLTAELETSPPQYVAGLARQLQAVLGELSSMPDPAAPPSLIDDIKSRYDLRRELARIDNVPPGERG